MATSRLPFIPENITVHLGPPDSPAPNVTVPFVDYIKNVASSEIYPTWPENAIRANIYAQISYALNRIYTEWYRSKGYDFDITNSTQYDQAFTLNRDYFENISTIVDDVFDSYVQQQGSIEPYFTQYCNGTTSKCPGLSQWGTVDLAKKGLTPYEILQYYYGDNINIIMDVPIKTSLPSYPGVPLRLGMAGNDVKTLQVQLNRISNNYPSIPKIIPTDGVFGVETEKAVKEFQKIFNLTQDGIVGKSTWYKIKQVYTSVKQLSELSSEGIQIGELEVPFEEILQQSTIGPEIKVLQYYLDVFGYFNPGIPYVTINGVFDEDTKNAVVAFQKLYGLTADGIVGRETWDALSTAYKDVISGLPSGYEGTGATIYPGIVLKQGSQGEAVTDLQTYLSLIADTYTSIPKIPVTGLFGEQTKAAVEAFQREFGFPVTSVVGPITWNKIGEVYNELALKPKSYS